MTTSMRKLDVIADMASPPPAPQIVAARAVEACPWRASVLSTRRADISIRQTMGTKLPILLLHGGRSCKDIFDRQLASHLGAQHRMIAIDWPGHGASSDAFNPARTYCLDGLADLAVEVLEALDIDVAVVVGASLGAWVGLQMIEGFPGLAGLALTGASLANIDDAPFGHAAHRTDARAIDLLRRDIEANAMRLARVAASESAPPIMVVDGAERPTTAVGGALAQSAAWFAPKNYAIPHGGGRAVSRSAHDLQPSSRTLHVRDVAPRTPAVDDAGALVRRLTSR